MLCLPRMNAKRQKNSASLTMAVEQARAQCNSGSEPRAMILVDPAAEFQKRLHLENHVGVEDLQHARSEELRGDTTQLKRVDQIQNHDQKQQRLRKCVCVKS